jgi:hypothetical protein
MKKCFSVVSGVLLLTLVSCGEKTSARKKLSMQNFFQTEKGIYEAELHSLNSHLAGEASGKAVIKLRGDEMIAQVQMNGTEGQIVHPQYLHMAEECPTLSSDTNKDGVIDDLEGRMNYGSALIPFDSDLSTQVEASSIFPKSDFSGNYSYSSETSWTKMITDLLLKDSNPSDGIVKLKSALNFKGRVVVIKGISTDVKLPETVQALENESVHASVPIACGILMKVASADDYSDYNGGKD